MISLCKNLIVLATTFLVALVKGWSFIYRILRIWG